MIDFYYDLRQKMIAALQPSLKQIRQVLGFGVQEFAELIGVTRQSINNLETGKSSMSVPQYLSVCAVIDNCVRDRPELLSVLSTILCSNDADGSVFQAIEGSSLLRKWFLCFDDSSKIHQLPCVTDAVLNASDFKSLAENYRVFLDETVLSAPGFPDTVRPLVQAMQTAGSRFIIPLKSIEAVQQQILQTDPAAAARARDAVHLLAELQKQQLLDIRGEKNDTTIIGTFVSVFAKFKSVHRLALLTCNPRLALQISALNDDAMGGFHILILTSSEELGLHLFDEDDRSQLPLPPEQPERPEAPKQDFSGWDAIF